MNPWGIPVLRINSLHALASCDWSNLINPCQTHFFLHHCFSDFRSFKALSGKRGTGYLSGAIFAFLGIFIMGLGQVFIDDYLRNFSV